MALPNVQMELMRKHVVKATSNIISWAEAYLLYMPFRLIPLFVTSFNAILLNVGACGGDFTPSTPNGILTSPLHADTYPRDQECFYTISQKSGTYISLQIKIFGLLVNPARAKCQDTKIQDFIEIRDGNSSESLLIGEFCGTDIPGSIQSTRNNIWIRLTSNIL